MNKKCMSLVLCLALTLTMFFSPEQAMAKKVKKPKLNKKKVTLYVGKSVRLKVKGAGKKVKWKSSNKKIATVSSKGKVKAKKKGKAKITAKFGKKKLVCRVTVKVKKSTAPANSNVSNGGQTAPDAGVSQAPNGNGNTGASTQPPSGTDGSANPQQSPGVGGSEAPQPSSGAGESEGPQPSAGVGESSKPQPSSEVGESSRPQPSSGVGESSKPQPSSGVSQSSKPQPSSGASQSSKPQPSSGAGQSSKPQPSAGAGESEGPQPSAGASEEPRVPALSKQASFENGTDGFVAQGNASIQVAEGGYAGKCLQISNRKAEADGVAYDAGKEVAAGEGYTVQGYVKLGAGSGTLKCKYQTGDGADQIHELLTVPVADGWVKFRGTIQVPQDFTKLNIWFELADTTETTFYVDEISITEIVSIKDTFDGIFGKTGTCINLVQLEDPETLKYVKKHYSSFTLENEMKPDYLMPGWLQPVKTEDAKAKTGDYVIPESYKESTVPQFNYSTVDKVLRIAKENGLKIRYHVLVWHSQSPEWFFKEGYSQDESAAYVSEEKMNARMEMYIRSVIHHVYTLDGGAYKDVVYTWDVANEYFSNTPDANWSAVYGNRDGKLGNRPPFIKKAFELAYDELEKFSLAQSVPLFYNDFNTYMTTDKIIEMINYINSDRKVCSGVGMQSHLALQFPSVDSYVNTVKAFIEEGFQVQITELDVGCSDKDTPEEELPALYENQAEYVGELTEKLIALQNSSNHAITGLTWWGLYDDASWRKESHVLMFDRGLYDAKPSYFAFMRAAGPIGKPEPTPTPVPTPTPTAPPVLNYDFTDTSSYENELPASADYVVNEDGSITLTFKSQFAAFNFYLPESGREDSDYKSVVLTYTSQGDDLGHSLYDEALKKDTDWGRKIKASPDGDQTLTFNVTDNCAGDRIFGFQIFNPNELKDGKTITITIKSMIFCGKKDPTEEDLKPMPTMDPIGPYVKDTNVSVPSGYTSRNESVAGTVEDITYDSTVIKEGAVVQRKAKVVLPKGYTKDKKYPVVYMQHGIFGNETTLYGDNTQYVIWNAIANGDAEEMIVVFPNACANEAGAGEGFNLEHYAAYDNFINDLSQCLMPYINEHYSTLTGRENTAICGFSMGGRVSLHIGFTLQDKFRYIGGFCPTFGILEYENYGVHEDGLFTPETFTLQEQYMDDTLVLIAAGPNDTIVKTEPKRYSDTLKANGVPHLYYETQGGEDEKGDGGHSGDVYKHGLYNFVSRIFHRGSASKPEVKPTPEPAAPSAYTLDLTADRRQEASNNATQNVQADGTAAVTFGNYEGIHYLLPNTEAMKAAQYKYVTVTYESTGDDLEVYLYNGETDLGAASIADLGENKKASAVKLTPSGKETAVTYSVEDESPAGGAFRGIQIFHWAGSQTNLTIKSIIFSKEKPGEEGWVSLPLTGMSGGVQQNGQVLLDGIDQVTIPLPQKIEGKGKKLEVTVSGTLAENSGGLRMWLSQDEATASDQYHFTKTNGVGFGGKGDGDLAFKTGDFSITKVLTVGNNNEAIKLETANRLLLKAPEYGLKMTGVTITGIRIREVNESDAAYKWVTTWGTAEEKCDVTDSAMPQMALQDSTVRQIIRVTTGGDKLRLRLSNQYGGSDVQIKSLHLAKQVKADASTIDTSTDAVVTVGGKVEFVIPKGQVIQTDPVDFAVDALDNVAISAYFGTAPTQNITGHRGARATTYQVSGNEVSTETLASYKTTTSWFFLADASIWSSQKSKAVVCFGDSITDGYGTDATYLGKKPDSYTRWIDYFARRLQANEGTTHISLINEGIGSNSILGAYPTDAGKDRFARDLLEHDGVAYCIILFGVNDLNKLEDTSKYAQMLPEYQKMIKLCHDNGIKVYGAPILPFGTNAYYSEASEEVRTMINDWMRSADSELDGIIDFESAVADPANPKNLLEAYTHEDGLHPYDGYEAMANAIDLTMFE